MLTTTYNHSRFIGDCIRSVQLQTFGNFEHVIVDDGSTDGTGTVVKSFNDKRIVYVRQKHVGIGRLGETYNRGLNLARGKYIAILEGDDFYPKRKLELQIGSLQDDDVVLSFGKVVRVDQDLKFLGVSPCGRKFKSVTDWLGPLIVHDYITALTVMMKKEALLKVGGFIQPAGAGYVDYATFLELALIGKFKFVDEVLGFWVRHGGNYSDADLFSNINNKYSIQFCKKHGIPVPWKALSQQKGKDLFHVGRHQLLTGNKQEAMKCFSKSFKLSPCFGKVKSVGGMVAATSGFDLEWTARRLGRPVERRLNV